jgi:hypothetical protein
MLAPLDKRIGRRFQALILVAIALGPAWVLPAAAQAPDKTIQDATLQLWSEYDDPGLLVIYSGAFTDTLAFPQDIAFPLPDNARGIQATARETDGRLITQPWQILDGKLAYSLPGPGFHIEYYLDRPPSGDQREFSYTFETPYAIDSLSVRVQHPARATDFSLTPPAESSGVGEDGFTYSELRRTNLKPGDKFDVKVRYKKTDQGLTRPSGAAAPSESTPQVAAAPATAAASGLGSWLPYLLIGVGLLALLGAAIYWFLRGRKSPAPAHPVAGAHRPKTAPSAAPTGAPDKATAFCTQCGRQYASNDRFCAGCGARRQGFDE